MPKRQWLKESDGSLYLAVAATVISLIEGSEDVDLGRVRVSGKLADPAWVLTAARGRKRVEVEVSGINFGVLRGAVRGVDVVLRPDDRAELPLMDVYTALPINVLRLDFSSIRPLARETSESGVEFMIMYVDTGDQAVLEGDVFRVSVPFVKALATLHTHPEGGCALSRKDVESGLELLTEGGLFAGAITESCAFLMVRRGLVSEDDFVNVKSNRLDGLETIKFVRALL